LIAQRIPRGELHLVDHSPWMVRFLTEYFHSTANIKVHLGDGHSLPLHGNAWVDVVFVAGTLIALKLGTIRLYALDFARVLKPGGVLIFDYLDPTTTEGWAHLQLEGSQLPDVYTYHAPDVIDRVFSEAGFEGFERQPLFKHTFFTARRSST
jgi:ubiquinone/menaquinone biosynthesis C-methylase UbiE